MKRETLFLKVVIFLIGIPILGLPWIARGTAEMSPELAYLQYPLYATAIPFFFALYQTLKSSELSVEALKNIKYCAITISTLYAVGMPRLFIVGHEDDAPGVVALGLVIIIVSIVIAVFASKAIKKSRK